MKTLYIIRHAKSSWNDPNVSDFDRVLNERGKRDAPEMGRRLAARHIKPDHVVSSPARRALTTAEVITGAIGMKEIELNPDIYNATDKELLKVIQAFPDKNDSVMLFGHNSGITELVNALSSARIENVPTCGVAGISFEVDHWSEIGTGKGKLVFYDFPKSKTS